MHYVFKYMHGVPVVSHPGPFHTHSGVVVSHPIFFSDQLFYCSNIIIIISGKVTKIVYICIIYKISAQKLKYLIYICSLHKVHLGAF